MIVHRELCEVWGALPLRELILDPYLYNAALDLLMDGTLLWVAAAVTRQDTRWHRILAGALCGGLYNLWLSLAEVGVLPGLLLLAHPLVLFFLLPLLMLGVVFVPVGIRRFIRLGLVFYLFALLSWGSANALYYYLMRQGQNFNRLIQTLSQIGLALVVAELGWGAIHRQAVDRVCRVPLRIELGSLSLEAEGFLDTGNRLLEPVTRQPVVVLDYSLLRQRLTSAAREFIEALAGGDVPPKLPADDPWLTRLRVIPYHTLHESGLMPGLRIDRLRIGSGRRVVDHSSAIIGLELTNKLAGDCQALVPPALWTA